MVHPRDQISDAVEAPCREMISGATVENTDQLLEFAQSSRASELTPVRSTDNVVVFLILNRTKIERDTEVRQANVCLLGDEDVGSFEVTMYDL